MSNWFPKWRSYEGNIDARPVGTSEYLPASQSAILGVQHAFAMFGATVLAPFLMGFGSQPCHFNVRDLYHLVLYYDGWTCSKLFRFKVLPLLGL